MKKLIRASALQSQRAEAEKVLKGYTSEQIDFVYDCVMEQNEVISKYYTEDGEVMDIEMGPELREIRRDYAMQADEDQLLDPEEFDELYEAIQLLDGYDAMANA